MGLGQLVLGYSLVMGVLLVVAGSCVKKMGGSFGSANTRKRMQEWGSEIEEKRQRDLGFLDEKPKGDEI